MIPYILSAIAIALSAIGGAVMLRARIARWRFDHRPGLICPCDDCCEGRFRDQAEAAERARFDAADMTWPSGTITPVAAIVRSDERLIGTIDLSGIEPDRDGTITITWDSNSGILRT